MFVTAVHTAYKVTDDDDGLGRLVPAAYAVPVHATPALCWVKHQPPNSYPLGGAKVVVGATRVTFS